MTVAEEKTRAWKWRVDSILEAGETVLYVTPAEYQELVGIGVQLEDERIARTAEALSVYGIEPPEPHRVAGDVTLAWGTEVIVDRAEALEQARRVDERARRKATVSALAGLIR